MSLAERMAGKIRIIQDIPIWSKMLIYGPAGVGKTKFGATAPKPIFVNADGGTLTIAKNRIKIPGFDVNNFLDMNNLAEFLSEHVIYRDKLYDAVNTSMSAKAISQIKDKLWLLDHVDGRGANEPLIYESVVMDTFDEIQKKSMDGILLEPKRLEKQDPDKATLDDWGKNHQQSRKLVRFFKDLPLHLVMLCHDVNDSEETGEPMVRPMMTPKLATEVMGYMDMVGYLYVKPTDTNPEERKMLIKPWKKYRAKIRCPEGVVAPMALTNPVWDDVYQYIGGSMIS